MYMLHVNIKKGVVACVGGLWNGVLSLFGSKVDVYF